MIKALGKLSRKEVGNTILCMQRQGGSDPQKPSSQVRKQAQKGAVTCSTSHSK